jgi:penicillin amidase
MFENDDIDFYREVNSPRDGNKYKTPAGFSDYTIRGNYQSKDTTDVVLNVKVSRHGPVMNGLITGLDNNEPVAMSWIYTQPIHILDAVYTHMQKKNKADFQKGLLFSPGIKRDVW